MATEEEKEAEREQAAIDAEKAATRRLEAAVTRAAIRDVADSVGRRDGLAAGAAAERLHRVHALHEQLAGRLASARSALERARAAQARLQERR